MIKQETWTLSLLLLFYLQSSSVPNKSSGIVQLMLIETSGSVWWFSNYVCEYDKIIFLCESLINTEQPSTVKRTKDRMKAINDQRVLCWYNTLNSEK